MAKASSDTEPSDGHSPTGATPKRCFTKSCASSNWRRAAVYLVSARIGQLAVARVAVDHVRGVGVEGVPEQEFLLGIGERFGRFQSQLQEWIARLAGCVLFHLGHHGGHQVEGLLHVR